MQELVFVIFQTKNFSVLFLAIAEVRNTLVFLQEVIAVVSRSALLLQRLEPPQTFSLVLDYLS